MALLTSYPFFLESRLRRQCLPGGPLGPICPGGPIDPRSPGLPFSPLKKKKEEGSNVIVLRAVGFLALHVGGHPKDRRWVRAGGHAPWDSFQLNTPTGALALRVGSGSPV